MVGPRKLPLSQGAGLFAMEERHGSLLNSHLKSGIFAAVFQLFQQRGDGQRGYRFLGDCMESIPGLKAEKKFVVPTPENTRASSPFFKNERRSMQPPHCIPAMRCNRRHENHKPNPVFQLFWGSAVIKTSPVRMPKTPMDCAAEKLPM